MPRSLGFSRMSPEQREAEIKAEVSALVARLVGRGGSKFSRDDERKRLMDRGGLEAKVAKQITDSAFDLAAKLRPGRTG